MFGNKTDISAGLFIDVLLLEVYKFKFVTSSSGKMSSISADFAANTCFVEC